MSLTPTADTDYYLLEYLPHQDIFCLIQLNSHYRDWIHNLSWMVELNQVKNAKNQNIYLKLVVEDI